MNSREIRKKFQNYFASQDHLLVPSSSLIPDKGLGLLFTNAGMNQFKNSFLGLAPPPHPQAFSIQKCLRAGGKHNDLEQVGRSPYHHTFFEMLGFFSFGSYFKKQAIDYALSFLTKELNIPKDRLWVSVFKEDKESAQIWQRVGSFPPDRIFFLGEKDNYWRMASKGPSGPCSEIYYYDGPKKSPAPQDMTEIWNLVFMEFNEEAPEKRHPLSTRSVDTGMGLERLTAILQEKKNNYHTDLFESIISQVAKESDVAYTFVLGEKTHPPQARVSEINSALQVIADHSRAVSFLISEGVRPGAGGADYVLRRLIRRALFYSRKLHAKKNLLNSAVQKTIETMGLFYPELKKEQTVIHSVIKTETELFSESLKEGQSILEKKIQKLFSGKKSSPCEPNKAPLSKGREPLVRQSPGAWAKSNKTSRVRQQAISPALPNDMVWDMYSTYGFPPDLTRLIAQEKGFTVNENFHLANYKEQGGGGVKKDPLEEFFRAFALQDLSELSKVEFTGYQNTEDTGKICLILQSHLDDPETLYPCSFIEKAKDPFWLITDKTCFYPEGGGPKGERGFLESKTGKAKVLDCQKRGKFIAHKIKLTKGTLQKGQHARLKVDKIERHLTAGAHSATHLLHGALRKVLGPEVRQKGSLVEPGKLRFDFNYSKPLSLSQLKEVEDEVLSSIAKGQGVHSELKPYKIAREEGALSLAGENYEQKVRVIRMGESLELCGGIHVKNTQEVGGFKVLSETGVQSGVRRITAYTGDVFKAWQSLMIEQNQALRLYLKLPLLKNLDERKDIFLPFLQKKDQEIKALKMQLARLSASSVSSASSAEESISNKAPQAFTYQGQKGVLLKAELRLDNPKILADTADRIKDKISSPAVVLVVGEGSGRFPVVVLVSKELKSIIPAGQLLKNTIAPFLDGKGGGEAHFARGMIKNKNRLSQLKEALVQAGFDFT